MSAEREKFVRHANKVVNEAIEAIHRVSELSNTTRYEYHQEDVDKIAESLHSEVEACLGRFRLAMKLEDWVRSGE